MSDRPIDLDLTSNTEVSIDKVPTPEELSQYRAKLAQVLDRTLTVDRLNVNLPSHLAGFWSASDSMSIAAAELRGFKIDDQYALKNGLVDVADGKARIADVVYMIRPKWMEAEEKKLINQRYYENHIRDKRKQKEEREFLTNNELPAEVRSSTTEVSGPEISETLSKLKG